MSETSYTHIWDVYTFCLLLMKGQISKRHAVQRLKTYSFLIRSGIWSGRALWLGTKVTTSDNFRAGFNTLSLNQAVYSVFTATIGTNPETPGHTAILNRCTVYIMIDSYVSNVGYFDRKINFYLCYSCYPIIDIIPTY